MRGFKVLHMSPLFLRPDAHVKVLECDIGVVEWSGVLCSE